MKKPSIMTLASIAANLILAASLAHVYQTTSDTAFKTWVDQNILSTFTLVLSGSIIAGSTLGYFLLRRKAPNMGIGGRLQRIGPQKQPSLLPRPGGISSQARNVPMGPPPGPTSKHTAYAVPPLSKAPSQPPKQSTSWSAAPRQWSPATFRAQRQEPEEVPNSPEPSYPTMQVEPQPSVGAPGIPPADRQPTGQVRQPEFTKPIPPPLAPAREPLQTGQIPRWVPQPGSQPLPPRTPAQYQSPTSDNQPAPPYLRQPLGPTADRPQGFAPPNNAPSRLGPTGPANSWTEPASTPAYSPPQKWLPPSASPVARTQALTSPSLGQSPQNEPRQNLPGPQGAPRPLGYAGPLRQAPVGEVPRYQERRPSAPSSQPAPGFGTRPIPGARPGQTDNMLSPSSPRPDMSRQSPTPSSRPDQSDRPRDLPPTTSPTTGEMDWDTALDAILKTLRKDKVEDKP